MDVRACPVGSVILWGGYAPPDGWLFCDGQRLAVAGFLPLFAVLGYRYGGAEDAFDLPRLPPVADRELQTYPSATPGKVFPAHPPQVPLKWVIRAA